MKPSITIIVPALNEEENLAATMEMTLRAIDQRFQDYEILIFNDGSQDRTGEIAEQLAAGDAHIQVIHHQQNMGVGYTYAEGIRLAQKEYTVIIAGDFVTCIGQDDLEALFDKVGQTDMTLVYLRADDRPLVRRMISRNYVRAMNLLFGLKLKGYNGAHVYKSDLLKRVKTSTAGYGIFAEIVIRLLKSGHSYVEVGWANIDTTSNTKAFRLKTFIQVSQFVLKLFWELQMAPALKIGYAHRKQGVEMETD
jgi:dolichol-phosphate mannosyltransferase